MSEEKTKQVFRFMVCIFATVVITASICALSFSVFVNRRGGYVGPPPQTLEEMVPENEREDLVMKGLNYYQRNWFNYYTEGEEVFTAYLLPDNSIRIVRAENWEYGNLFPFPVEEDTAHSQVKLTLPFEREESQVH